MIISILSLLRLLLFVFFSSSFFFGGQYKYKIRRVTFSVVLRQDCSCPIVFSPSFCHLLLSRRGTSLSCNVSVPSSLARPLARDVRLPLAIGTPPNRNTHHHHHHHSTPNAISVQQKNIQIKVKKSVRTLDSMPATSDKKTEEKVWLNSDEPEDPYKMYALTAVPPKAPQTMRLWVDGCFDMMHFGHANLLRQAYYLGVDLNSGKPGSTVEVFVGCHSDEEIIRVKGPPIMRETERYAALRACKWTTFLVENYPYCTRLKDMERFEVDFVVHGDDISTGPDGKNSYQEIIDAGRFKVVKRTESISTTELVGRMLLCTRNHLMSVDDVKEEVTSTFTRKNFLTSNRKIIQFSNNKSPKATDRVVYVDGGFDLFHVGHMEVLRQARALGDYLLVGLYEDRTINEIRGNNYPIMNLNERMLGLLSCRYVDEVILGVPCNVTEELIKSFNISLVVRGTRDDSLMEGYDVPKKMGILREVESGYPLTTEFVIQRVLENRQSYLERQVKKVKKDEVAERNKPKEYQNIKEL